MSSLRIFKSGVRVNLIFMCTIHAYVLNTSRHALTKAQYLCLWAIVQKLQLHSGDNCVCYASIVNNKFIL